MTVSPIFCSFLAALTDNLAGGFANELNKDILKLRAEAIPASFKKERILLLSFLNL
jgi:hypothetical protein